MGRKKWSNEEMEFIKNNLSNMNISELTDHFDIPYAKMIDKVHKMGLNRKKASGEYWSKEEDKILAKHFIWAPKNYILDLLPNRTWQGILQRGIKALNLNRESQDRYSVNYRFFEEWTPESAYIFGFIASDGHLFYESGKANKNALQFEIANYDKDILEKIKAIMEYEGPICNTKRDTVKLQMSNKKIIKDLIEKGIPIKNKTFDLKYPETLPEELDRHFIRGLLDGDGSIYKKDDRMTIQFLGTEDLLISIKSKIKFNLDSISIYDRSKVKGGAKVYSFQIANKKSYEIAKWLYKDSAIHLDRKYKKAIELHSEYKNWVLLKTP